jgi:hypothetical protein
LGKITNVYNPDTRQGYYRGITGDQFYRGWLGTTDYRGKVMFAGTQEETEMGGYIGDFTPADVWSYRGPSLDNAQYMFFDINDPGTTSGAGMGTSATQWFTGTYPFIQSAGKTNQVSPYQ